MSWVQIPPGPLKLNSNWGPLLYLNSTIAEHFWIQRFAQPALYRVPSYACTSELKRNRAILALLLIIPFVLNLWVTLYDIATPTALGLPFFWWFQIILLPVSAVFYIVFAFSAGDEA
jgi:hypothetical protein